MIRRLLVQGYRSLRYVWVTPGTLTVIVGPNGSGKTNLYRSLELLSQAARGELARGFLREGGFQGTLWAGGRRKNQPVRLTVQVELSETRVVGQAGED